MEEKSVIVAEQTPISDAIVNYYEHDYNLFLRKNLEMTLTPEYNLTDNIGGTITTSLYDLSSDQDIMNLQNSALDCEKKTLRYKILKKIAEHYNENKLPLSCQLDSRTRADIRPKPPVVKCFTILTAAQAYLKDKDFSESLKKQLTPVLQMYTDLISNVIHVDTLPADGSLESICIDKIQSIALNATEENKDETTEKKCVLPDCFVQ